MTSIDSIKDRHQQDLKSIQLASEVFGVEINGLKEVSDSLLDDSSVLADAFKNSVNVLLAVKGRVIVSGMGKSGHIARKIAATLASTGTPANYVHPGEASHGDLGMITTDDVVIALSNSGETVELGDLIGYCGRFGIPLIAMTSGANSNLAVASDHCLLVPKSKEACSITKAPTTSTTQMLALGDALAVTLLKMRGFSQSDFHRYHPGGKLGAALKRVTDLMHHKQMPLVERNTKSSKIIEVITKAGFGCCGVMDQGRLIGMITDGDLRRTINTLTDETTAELIMTPEPCTISHHGLAAEALSLLSQHKITSLFIVDDEKVPVGLLHVHDCLDVGVI